jgi:hypothetical protein
MKALVDNTPPTIESFTVTRRYLTEREVEKLMDTARKVSRHGHRDAYPSPAALPRAHTWSWVRRSLLTSCSSSAGRIAQAAMAAPRL